jgi:hypothetical protein
LEDTLECRERLPLELGRYSAQARGRRGVASPPRDHGSQPRWS